MKTTYVLVCALIIVMTSDISAREAKEFNVSAMIGLAVAVISISAVLAISWMAFARQGFLLAPGFTVTIIVAVYLSCTISQPDPVFNRKKFKFVTL